jgi:hypothetical protein
MDRKLLTGMLVLLAALSGYLLALQGRGMRSARAQQASRDIICQVGDQTGGDVPVVLVDTDTQRLVVYEYDLRGGTLEMGGVRPYTYDVRSGPYENRGPSVGEVQARVQRGGPFRR